jgi:hypothetical protein
LVKWAYKLALRIALRGFATETQNSDARHRNFASSVCP